MGSLGSGGVGGHVKREASIQTTFVEDSLLREDLEDSQVLAAVSMQGSVFHHQVDPAEELQGGC